MARGADVAHGTRADATRHTRPRDRAERAHVELRWCHVVRMRGRGQASPHERPGGATLQEGADKWRAHGLVGPGNRIGAVAK